MSKVINIPDLGDTEDVEVIEILVNAGDEISADDPVIVLESAKASMDIPCPDAGTVESIDVKVGDKVNSGDAMLTLVADEKAEPDPDGPAETEEASSSKEPSTQQSPSETADQAAAPTQSKTIHASPAVRRIATEHDVDLNAVQGTGPHGRITKADVQDHLGDSPAPSQERSAPADPKRPSAASPVPLSRIQKLSAQHLHNSWAQIPHVTHFDDADITELEEWRQELKSQRQEPKLSLLPFVMKAVSRCLQLQPKFNCQLSEDGENLIYNSGCHLGIAVNTEDGLVVPVIRNVDTQGVWDLASKLSETASRARSGQLKTNELQGGSFTISNLGGIGGQHFTPIINQPEVGILGLGQARWQLQRANNGEIVDRLIQPLALSYDHRVIDGAIAAEFVATLKHNLEDLRNVLL